MCFNLLELLVFLFLITMLVRGYNKGLLKISISLIALLSSVIALNLINPYLRKQLQENTKIRSMAIDELNVPVMMKDILKKNDDRTVYEKLGVYTFSDYIASYVTQMIVNAISYVGSFVFVWLVLGILFKGNKLLGKLPVLGGLNKKFGALAGFAMGLIIYWILCIFIIAFSTIKPIGSLAGLIDCSPFLVFLSRLNPIAFFLML